MATERLRWHSSAGRQRPTVQSSSLTPGNTIAESVEGCEVVGMGAWRDKRGGRSVRRGCGKGGVVTRSCKKEGCGNEGMVGEMLSGRSGREIV